MAEEFEKYQRAAGKAGAAEGRAAGRAAIGRAVRDVQPCESDRRGGFGGRDA